MSDNKTHTHTCTQKNFPSINVGNLNKKFKIHKVIKINKIITTSLFKIDKLISHYLFEKFS